MPKQPCVFDRAEAFLADRRDWRHGLLLDIGSTYTKALVIDKTGLVIGRAQAATTIADDVMSGVIEAIGSMPEHARGPYDWSMAASSAAGGLRMASIGLTAPLSGRAGALAALGAGAKVVSTEHGFLDGAAVRRIAEAKPHLLLVAGGLDGGNRDSLLHNADMLSRLSSPHGFVVAGNADAAQATAKILENRGHDVRIVDNVFPRAGEISITATREAVRELFLRHITRAKGLDGLMEALKTDCEPTPLAVSRGLGHVPGADGSVVFVDLGGATTDVHSLGGAREEHRNAELPEPKIMRTVEGDLGMRWGARGTVAAMSPSVRKGFEDSLGCDLEVEARRRHEKPSLLPSGVQDHAVDCALAEGAVATALERHAGRVVVRHRPWGDRYKVTGKDLRRCRVLVATGGFLGHAADATTIVSSALKNTRGAQVPQRPEIIIDHDYALYAIGLVSRLSPDLAQALSISTLAPARKSQVA